MKSRRHLQNLEDEIREHIARETQDNIDRGMDPEAARAAAVRKFGNVARTMEDTREVWWTTWFGQLAQDARYGLRMMGRDRGFAIAASLTLALGIGLNSAVFSVADAVLWRPPGLPFPDRLVWMANFNQNGQRENWVARADYAAWRNEAHSFERMAGYGDQDLAMIADGQASQERVVSIAGDFWDIAGAQARYGRLFPAAEADSLVISHRLFEQRFGGDPRVIGKPASLNGHIFHVTGVLDRGFRFRLPQQVMPADDPREVDAYIPVPDAALRVPDLPEKQWQEMLRGLGPAPDFLSVVGRLKPGTPIAGAKSEMLAIYARLAQRRPARDQQTVSLHFVSLQEKLAGETRPALLVLLAASGFVLLIAGTNLANLLLARASTRRREISIRAALGAGRTRVVRQFAVESVLLALVGGVGGLLLARAALAVMRRIAPQIPRLTDARIDFGVLAFTLAVSLVAGLTFGLGPAISLWRADLHDALKADSRTASAGKERVLARGLLVIAEVALAMILLAGAGLMLKSFWRMNAAPPGVSPEETLTMRVALAGPRYAAWPAKASYMQELLRRVESAPGVRAAGIDTATLHTTVKLDDSPGPFVSVRYVSPGYLRAIGAPLLRGEWPTDRDAADRVVVNESFARAVSGPGDIVGRRIQAASVKATVTGVVADFKYWQLDGEPGPEVYAPYALMTFSRNVRVTIRTQGNPMAAAPALVKEFAAIDPDQPVFGVQTLEQTLSNSIAPRRFNLFLLAAFAASALLLAVAGIYGVVSYTVAQRTHEIGVRMALGARRSEVVRMVIGQVMKAAVAGIAIGLGAAFWLTRLMAGMLYGVKPNDPPALVTASVVLGATALAATWLPAMKAALVDPVRALWGR